MGTSRVLTAYPAQTAAQGPSPRRRGFRHPFHRWGLGSPREPIIPSELVLEFFGFLDQCFKLKEKCAKKTCFGGLFFKPKSLSALLHLFGETQQQTRHFSFQVSRPCRVPRTAQHTSQLWMHSKNHCSRQLSPDKTLPTEQEKCRNPDSTEAKQPHQTLDRQNDFFIPKCFSNTNVQ